MTLDLHGKLGMRDKSHLDVSITESTLSNSACRLWSAPAVLVLLFPEESIEERFSK
jgi:hypothetical protein